MKIYEIGTGYTPIPAQMGAATEIVVEELTRSFLKSGNNVEIIDIKAKNRAKTELPITEVSVPSMFTKSDVSLGMVHKLKRVIYSVSLARKLKKLLKETQDRVVLHFHNQYNCYFFLKMVSKKLRKKAIVAYTVHSYIWGTDWENIKDTVKKKYFQEVFCVKNADAVLVLNDITIDHFVNHIGVRRENIYKIANGVNIERYSKLPGDEVFSFKESLGLSSKKVIFQVGSVCERKNQLGSLKMLSEYLQANRDTVYMYAGGIIDAEYQASILKLANDAGISEQVIYAGELAPGEMLNKYYNIADCSVFTSTLESFGLVIIEAISSGTPVIIGKNLMFDLNDGYLMYSDEKEFINCVTSALQSDKEFYCKSELEKYSWDTVAKSHLVIFEKL